MSGLTCGITALESDRSASVTILSRDFPPFITSNVAAAVWYPYLVGPRDRVLEWGRITFERLTELADNPESGVIVRPFIELLVEPEDEPWWRSMVPSVRLVHEDACPSGFCGGFEIDAPIAHSTRYLEYLATRFRDLGGRFDRRVVSDLAEVAGDVIVNCAGLGSRELARDEDVYPIRGDVVRVTRPMGLDRCVSAEHHPKGITYIIVRENDCILGGRSIRDCWELDRDPTVAQEILERCTDLEPLLAGAKILEHRAGLRPGRDSIRVQSEQLPDGRRVIHNYGHGGAGFTLSWGCAAEAMTLQAAR